jgi:homoserine kinase
MQSITVKAPATVANLGSGFDLMGLAIHQTADEVTVTERSDNQVILQEIIGDGGLLPKKQQKTLAQLPLYLYSNI